MSIKNKKLIVALPIILLVIIVSIVTTMFLSRLDSTKDPNLNNKGAEMEKSAVVYFSRTNNTERVAKYIAEKTNSDIFEIEAKIPYTDEDIDWTIQDSRANLEQNDPSARPEIAKVFDISAYDTIYLGYPIWWGTIPKILNTFIETDALKDKKIFAFCTSGSSGIETSLSDLKGYGLNVLAGQRFSSSASDKEVESWLESL